MNKKDIRNAVQRGMGQAASGVKGAVRRMRLWQKAGLILCILSWIFSALIGAFCERLTSGMKDQTFASRWAPEGGTAQVSAFIAENARLSEDTVKALAYNFDKSFREASIYLSETQIENGAKLIDACYCGFGTADLSVGDEALSVTAIGVGGDFFNFHPLDLMDGYYFSEQDLMKDRVLLDDETAWRLFGSPYITGQSITVGGMSHVIAGVFRRPEGKFYKASGMGSYLIYMSYDSLCRYTAAGVSSGEDSGTVDDPSLRDAMAVPQGGEPAAETAKAGLQETEPAAETAAAAPQRTEPAEESAKTGIKEAEPAAESAEADRPQSSQGTAQAGGRGGEEGRTGIIPRTAAYASVKGPGPQPAIKIGDEEQSALKHGDAIGPAIKKEDGARPLLAAVETTEEEDGSDEKDDSGSELKEMPEDSSDDIDREEGLTGRWNGGSGNDDEGPGGKEEPDWNRICCYEVVLPNPLSGYALRMVRSALSESGVDMETVTVVDNTSRFDVLRLILMLTEPGVRSMQTAPIRYPYWENVALAWEDVLIPYALLQMVLRYWPVLFLLFLSIWYATHKSWTLGGVLRDIQDRIYDRQSEKIYGRKSAGALPHGGTGAGEKAGAGELPDGSQKADAAAAPESPPHEDGPQAKAPERDAGAETPEVPAEGTGPAGAGAGTAAPESPPHEDGPQAKAPEGDAGAEMPEVPAEGTGPAGAGAGTAAQESPLHEDGLQAGAPEGDTKAGGEKGAPAGSRAPEGPPG